MRSSSVPRNFMPRSNPIFGPYTNQPRESLSHASYKKRDSFRGNTETDLNNKSAMPSQSSISQPVLENNQNDPLNNWKEYMNHQTINSKAIAHDDYLAQKERERKYRNVLGQMMVDEQRKKKEDRKDLMSPPKQSPEELQAFLKLDKMRVEDEKKQYLAELKRIVDEKEEAKRKEQQARYQESIEFNNKMTQLREIDKHMLLQDKMSKQQSLNEYKNHMEIKRLESRNKHQRNSFSGQYFMNDDQREQHYAKIRSQLEKDKGYFMNFQEKEFERKRNLNNFINKNVEEKKEKDFLEHLRREEQHKQMQRQALENNQRQIMEKHVIAQRRKEEESIDNRTYQHNKDMMREIEGLEKAQIHHNKREYLDILRHQEEENRYRNKSAWNVMNGIERAINHRQNSPYRNTRPMNSLPFDTKSHERRLQERYLDNWLNKNPQNSRSHYQ